ncbi:hypothetical protein BT96DRAFT_937976 [Gymnopus androsaceus JB14]|uniref:Uncharacterized protein n=1 Tax=Gymnopus androsaceus JB14 TaxID=1447944 RepID=A0A6A4HUN7_9AGAR|nr:hypothetical protein BT96DRAFT_937976 [Gymnopus androsaceus JB14]
MSHGHNLDCFSNTMLALDDVVNTPQRYQQHVHYESRTIRLDENNGSPCRKQTLDIVDNILNSPQRCLFLQARDDSTLNSGKTHAPASSISEPLSKRTLAQRARRACKAAEKAAQTSSTADDQLAGTSEVPLSKRVLGQRARRACKAEVKATNANPTSMSPGRKGGSPAPGQHQCSSQVRIPVYRTAGTWGGNTLTCDRLKPVGARLSMTGTRAVMKKEKLQPIVIVILIINHSSPTPTPQIPEHLHNLVLRNKSLQEPRSQNHQTTQCLKC